MGKWWNSKTVDQRKELLKPYHLNLSIAELQWEDIEYATRNHLILYFYDKP